MIGENLSGQSRNLPIPPERTESIAELKVPPVILERRGQGVGARKNTRGNDLPVGGGHDAAVLRRTHASVIRELIVEDGEVADGDERAGPESGHDR